MHRVSKNLPEGVWPTAEPIMIADTSYVNLQYTNTLNAFEAASGYLFTKVYSIRDESSLLESKLDAVITPYLVVPSLPYSHFWYSLSASTQHAIRNYVNYGGKLIVCGDDSSNAIDLLNGMFGWSLTRGWSLNEASWIPDSRVLSSLNTTGVAETSFEGGPAFLPTPADQSYVHTVRLASLPPSARVMYTIVDVWVFGAPYGAGSVIYMGLAFERTPIDPTWTNILTRVLKYSSPTFSLPTSAPTSGPMSTSNSPPPTSPPRGNL